MSAFLSHSQLRLNNYHAFVFDDRFDFRTDDSHYHTGTIKGGYQIGLGLQYMIKEKYVELFYLRQNAQAPTYFQNDTTSRESFSNFGLKINYIMASGGSVFKISSEKVEGFGDLMAGAAIMEARNEEQDDKMSSTTFAWGLRLGINYWPVERFGLKLMGQLLAPTGGSLFFGSGGHSANLFASVHQFTLGGGIIFKLTHKNNL